MAVWSLHAGYDDEAKVWYTLDCDVPGLVTEGDTLGRLIDRAVAVMPELLIDNAHLVSPDRLEGPHSLRVVAFHERVLQLPEFERVAA